MVAISEMYLPQSMMDTREIQSAKALEELRQMSSALKRLDYGAGNIMNEVAHSLQKLRNHLEQDILQEAKTEIDQGERPGSTKNIEQL